MRRVSIPQDAVDLLIQEHNRHPENQYMFPSPATGEMYHPDSVAKLHEKILKDADLEHIPLHSLRHTFATVALQNGIDVKTVSSMLGHYDAGFTLRTYDVSGAGGVQVGLEVFWQERLHLHLLYLGGDAVIGRVAGDEPLSDLDAEHKTISVSKQYVRNPSGEVMLSRPKTETSVRQVSIPQEDFPWSPLPDSVVAWWRGCRYAR